MRAQKGITLVALIITIVVLLILAVVTIATIQNNDIIGYADKAANTYKQEEAIEKENLNEYKNSLNYFEDQYLNNK